MFTLSSSLKYFLYKEPTDMRKSFDSLHGLVLNRLQRNPFSGEVFIFINRTRNKIKLLHWEKGGFVLYYKRLESGTIELPKLSVDLSSYSLDWSELMLMVEGISIQNTIRRKRFLRY